MNIEDKLRLAREILDQSVHSDIKHEMQNTYGGDHLYFDMSVLQAILTDWISDQFPQDHIERLGTMIRLQSKSR
jgi:hypothetical protein